MKRKIYIITTGGTIDKSYDEFDGDLEISESLIKSCVLDKLRLPYHELVVETLMSIDSLDMTDIHREEICEKIKELSSDGDPVLIIHGTDTMSVTASYCFSRLKNLNSVVVFTGSMKPIGFEDSDGKQNVTESLMACKLLRPGFYISFHGEIFHVPHVKKDLKKGTFVHLSST